MHTAKFTQSRVLAYPIQPRDSDCQGALREEGAGQAREGHNRILLERALTECPQQLVPHPVAPQVQNNLILNPHADGATEAEQLGDCLRAELDWHPWAPKPEPGAASHVTAISQRHE